MIVINQKEWVGEFVADRMGVTSDWDKYEAIGISKNGVLVGGVVIDSYLGGMCSIHCAGDGNWLTRDFIKCVFNYAFNQLGCNAILNVVSSGNERSLRFTKHLGFNVVHIVKGGRGDNDAVLLELQKSNCRWI
jgi:RimJ/RimL family protein N-acetyltransferase